MRLAVVAGLVVITGCDDSRVSSHVDAVPQASGNGALHYHGFVLRFPKGTIDAISDEEQWPYPYARLMPDAPTSGDAVDARYKIELGRPSTGRQGPSGYGLGFGFYLPNALKTDLGDGYTMYCQPPERRYPAFYCAVLLQALPLAALEIKDEPSSPKAARAMVDEAEEFLENAKHD